MFLIINTYKVATNIFKEKKNNQTYENECSFKEIENKIKKLTINEKNNEKKDNREIINLNIFAISNIYLKFKRIDNSKSYEKEFETIEKGIIVLKEFIHSKFATIDLLQDKTPNEKTLLKKKLQEFYENFSFETIDLKDNIHDNFYKFLPIAYKRLKESNNYNSIDCWDFKDYSGYSVENKTIINGRKFRE